MRPAPHQLIKARCRLESGAEDWSRPGQTCRSRPADGSRGGDAPSRSGGAARFVSDAEGAQMGLDNRILNSSSSGHAGPARSRADIDSGDGSEWPRLTAPSGRAPGSSAGRDRGRHHVPAHRGGPPPGRQWRRRPGSTNQQVVVAEQSRARQRASRGAIGGRWNTRAPTTWSAPTSARRGDQRAGRRRSTERDVEQWRHTGRCGATTCREGGPTARALDWDRARWDMARDASGLAPYPTRGVSSGAGGGRPDT